MTLFGRQKIQKPLSLTKVKNIIICQGKKEKIHGYSNIFDFYNGKFWRKILKTFFFRLETNYI